MVEFDGSFRFMFFVFFSKLFLVSIHVPTLNSWKNLQIEVQKCGPPFFNSWSLCKSKSLSGQILETSVEIIPNRGISWLSEGIPTKCLSDLPRSIFVESLAVLYYKNPALTSLWKFGRG